LFRGKKLAEIVKNNKSCKINNKIKQFAHLSKSGDQIKNIINSEIFLAQNLLNKMLEKTSEKRINLHEICIHKWFLMNYHAMHSYTQIYKAESSTKVEIGASKCDFFSDCNSPAPKLRKKKAKLSCFGYKIADIDGLNEVDINKNSYAKFLESRSIESNSFLNLQMINALQVNKKKMKNSMEYLIVDQMKRMSLYLGVNIRKSVYIYLI